MKNSFKHFVYSFPSFRSEGDQKVRNLASIFDTNCH